MIIDTDHGLSYTPFYTSADTAGFIVQRVEPYEDEQWGTQHRPVGPQVRVYFNPSSGGTADNGDLFIYVGKGDPAEDEPLCFIDMQPEWFAESSDG